MISTIPSPCVGICRINEAMGLCIGCARTRAEIAAWRDAPDAVRKRIWAELPVRLTNLGLGLAYHVGTHSNHSSVIDPEAGPSDGNT